MSAKRVPMTPPDLPGFTYLDVLGSGGFADVYLYEQQLPRRRVAVKVLLTERMSTGAVDEFAAEANVMAMLSTHPAIVTIYQAGVAGDGRPYLVMEYCPKPNLQVRYKREPFSVAESLRIGVQVSAAVETAHRAGVLHRDIKPANILVTEYNRPALTDFGIASTTAAAAESAGLSIPWSPPESFADVPRSDPRSDVYALGATVYTLLAGRSPFEFPGERNTGADLIQRIETAALPPLARADAPTSLRWVLERATAKNSADRYESALAFARALQKVQIELSHSVTPIDILDDALPEDDIETDDGDGLTRVRGVVSIDPETSPAAGLTRPSATTAPASPRFDSSPAPLETVVRPDALDQTVLRPPAAPASDPFETVPRERVSAASVAPTETEPARPASPELPPPPEARTGPAVEAPSSAPPAVAPARRSRRTAVTWSLVGGGLAVIAAVIVGVSLPGILAGGDPTPPPPDTTAVPLDPVSPLVPAPEALTGVAGAEGVTFTWTHPDPQDGDHFLWAVDAAGGEAAFESTTETSVTVPADPSGRTCIEVLTARSNGQSSESVTGCAP
ncbi:serine/threonine-protein kinase [Microbacterium sp. SLBN-146]|uniref:serine/threonine-protein kinase n=1 Tax=Microbacterium sp. SLBN-146 TaxID=2768457 RepID=UPI0011514C04|nr:serine/threonine-protein kinase [Microbacterium sp. SLBN-146]TQJ30569.1 serine/threonine protein kinase [Microbacterium sp. SLBN-146]